MITLKEVQKVVPSAVRIETYNNGSVSGIKVFYTGRAPMWKKKNERTDDLFDDCAAVVVFGAEKFKWHYDEFPINGEKIRLYQKARF